MKYRRDREIERADRTAARHLRAIEIQAASEEPQTWFRAPSTQATPIAKDGAAADCAALKSVRAPSATDDPRPDKFSVTA